jgi:enoyl-CoA hydratase
MEELLYEADGPVATFTLNRPERLNAVTPRMIDELDAALARASEDDEIKVIRLRGAGRAFCAGYDLDWAAAEMERIDRAGPWDPMADYGVMSRFVDSYMGLWRSPKPVVAQVHGFCVGGGTDFALCSDLSCAPRTAGSATRRPACGARPSRWSRRCTASASAAARTLPSAAT